MHESLFRRLSRPALQNTLRLSMRLISFSQLSAIRASTSTGTFTSLCRLGLPPYLRSSPSPARPSRLPPALRGTRRPHHRGTRGPPRPLGTRPYAPIGGVYFSECANRRGAKSARRVSKGLLALLAPHHIRVSRITRLPAQHRRRDSY
jgi:hypothetical protein